jgi:class 3 adenylate cyclase/putative methionine-R-sulfoxide reductase with GAF domain
MKRRSNATGKPPRSRRPKASKAKSRIPSKMASSRSSRSRAETEVARLRRELNEALEQQTATSKVLQIIGSSPGDLTPVFASMLEKAVRICDAKFGNLYRWDGDALHLMASHNTPSAFVAVRGRSTRPGPTTPAGRAIATKTFVHVPDIVTEPAYIARDPWTVSGVQVGGVRTLLVMPMLKEYELVGTLNIYRQEVRPFTDKQIELVQNFAAQAVIAIENARLLNELRQSLEQQTAAAEVLQVISSSFGDLEPVFAAMLEKAVRICDASFGGLYRWDGDALHLVATHNTPAEFAEYRKNLPLHPNPKTASGRMVATKTIIHVADVKAEPAYIEGSDPAYVAAVELGGSRTVLAVPMLKEDELIGAILMSRQEVRPFADNQIELVRNFASQAVIAIENARLLGELRERTDEVVKLNQQLEQRVADQVGEIERMGRLRRFLPPQVADLIVASGTEKQLESHRREITALFCDLRGFTGFSEASAPEDVMALLRDYHAAIGEIIIKYSGTLERYAGDGVMVVFNDPVPVDNPALRAVLMALETREAMGALMEKWRQLGHDVGFGIGIAHGFATLGTIGFEGRFDYAAIGTVSNVASRLCDEAKPGQILISPRVFTAVKDAVTVEPVGEFTLKGIGRPLAAYNVLAAVIT